MRYALQARTGVGGNYDRANRTGLALTPVPVRTAAIPAVVVRASVASAGQCANWGALALLVPGLGAWSCAEYLYASGDAL